jgi:hypothetical protein
MSAEIEKMLADLQERLSAVKAAEQAAEAAAHPEKVVNDAINEVSHRGRQGNADMGAVGVALAALWNYIIAPAAPAEDATDEDTHG